MDSEKQREFTIAIGRGDVTKMESILAEFGPRIIEQNLTPEGKKSLHVAAGCGSRESVRFLLKRKAIVNSTDNEGFTSLHYGAKAGVSSVVRLLLAKGARPNDQAYNGDNPIHWCTTTQIFDVLVKAGCDIEVKNNDDMTAQHRYFLNLLKQYCIKGNVKAIDNLLKEVKESKGINIVDAPLDEQGMTSLMICSLNGNHKALELLIPMTKNINKLTLT